MELSRKKQIKRRQLPGFDDGKDYIDYLYGTNPYISISAPIDVPIVGNPGINTNLQPKTLPYSAKLPVPGENKYVGVNIPAILGFGADVYNQF